MHVQTDPAGKGEVPDRKRAWGVTFAFGKVIVRHYIVDLAPEEDIRDFPETHEMTRDEWAERHAEYGLTLDGSPA